MKRYLSFMLMVMLIVSTMPISVQAAEPVQSATEPAVLQDLAQYVNPLIGSNNFKGNSEFAGLAPFVTSPFGMTNFTPQTRQNSIGGISYLYSDKQFKGFFATHQPAIWMGDYGYVNVMPQIGDISPSESGRALTFDYKNNDSSRQENKEEVSTPYYYKAKMGSNVGKPITAEMTATERSAIYRYTFPANDKSSILVESARNRANGAVTIDANNKEIYGWNNDNMSSHLNNKTLQNLKGYFVIQFSKPFNVKGTYRDYIPTADGTTVEGQKSGGYVTFNTTANEVIEVRIGTSFISVEQARKNIEQEIGTKSFDTVKDELKNTWNNKLNTIQIEGATTDEKHIFYTSMFHALMYPRMFYENVDGTNKYYSPYDDQIHDGKSYTDFSIWDTFRAQNSFLTLVAPERIDDMVQSLLQNYKEGGYMPKWPNPNYTNIMIGTHADSLVAEAINKGFRGFDYNLAYQAVYKDAMAPQTGDGTIKWADRQVNVPYEARAGLSAYKELGYIPNGYVNENVSNTIEGAYDDWAVAQVAKAAGRMEDYKFFLNRSQNYKNTISPSTGYAMGRDVNGNWTTTGEQFTEGDRRKYTWFAPHDPQGLLNLMTQYKGATFYNTELEKAYGVGGSAWIEHQNEPTHHYPYMFNFSGRPDLAQKYVRKTLVDSYFNDTSGMLGNDDCGQMSAWYIFSAMGFYSVNPASGEYMIGSPIFDKVTINNPRTGAKFVITAPNNDGKNFYIGSATLNGTALNIPVITYDQITNGGTLDFVMSSTATDWARGYSKPALVYDETALNPDPKNSVVQRITIENVTASASVSATTSQIPAGSTDIGNPATSLIDGNYNFGYVSGALTTTSLSQTPYYLTMQWNTPKASVGSIAIYSNYVSNQGPRKVDIEVRHPGGDWTPVLTDYTIAWLDRGNNDAKGVIDFVDQSNVDGIRIKIKEANLIWGKIAVRELEVYRDLPAIIDLSNPSEYMAQITYNTNKLASIKLNERELVNGTDYSITGAKNNLVTINKSVFVRNGADASAKLVFNFNQGTSTTENITIVGPPNANLKALSLSSGELNPVFDPATTSYTATVPNSVSNVSVTAALVDSNSTVKINGQNVMNGQASAPISLNEGSNTITIVVTAADSTTKTYTVTVNRQIEVPVAVLGGVSTVVAGQPLVMSLGLSNVTQNVYQSLYGQVLTVHYDPQKLQLEPVTPVTSLKDGFQVIETKETIPGEFRIVAASLGAVVPAQGDLLAIKFKAKPATQAANTTISVDHVVIANAQGNELQVGGASREIQITVPAIPVDKALLNGAIASAQAKYAAAVEGNEDGQYAIGAKAQLQSAIDAANAVVNALNATQQQVDSAKVALESAIQVFESKKITADINGGGVSIGDLAAVAVAYGKQPSQTGWNAKADVNHDGKVDLLDLAIVAKAILK